MILASMPADRRRWAVFGNLSSISTRHSQASHHSLRQRPPDLLHAHRVSSPGELLPVVPSNEFLRSPAPSIPASLLSLSLVGARVKEDPVVLCCTPRQAPSVYPLLGQEAPGLTHSGLHVQTQISRSTLASSLLGCTTKVPTACHQHLW